MEPIPNIEINEIPYSEEINNVIQAVLEIRNFALNKLNISFSDYRKSLCMMTYSHSSHSKLNRPYVLSSLQILTYLIKQENNEN